MLPIHAILHPTDFSDHSEHAFHLACSLARDHGARLIVLHVWSIPTSMLFGEVVPIPDAGRYDRNIEDELHSYQPDGRDQPCEHMLVQGDPAIVILQVAKDVAADLIVMGTHGRRGLMRLLMGSVAEQVVRSASCPVVTVKNPFAEAEPAVSEQAVCDGAPLQEMVTG